MKINNKFKTFICMILLIIFAIELDSVLKTTALQGLILAGLIFISFLFGWYASKTEVENETKRTD